MKMFGLTPFTAWRLLQDRFGNDVGKGSAFKSLRMGPTRYEIFDIGTTAGSVQLFNNSPENGVRNNRTAGKLGQFFGVYTSILMGIWTDGATSTLANLLDMLQSTDVEVKVGNKAYLPRTNAWPFMTKAGNAEGTTGNAADFHWPACLEGPVGLLIPVRPDEEFEVNVFINDAPAAAMKGLFQIVGAEAHRSDQG
jgi:hypothetical protein